MVTYTEGNGLKIYVSGVAYPNHWIQCWAKRWDEDNYDITIETFLGSGARNFLFKHVIPGSIREYSNKIGWQVFLDGTFNKSSNTLILEPQSGYGLSGVRKRKIILVKNISDTFINNNYFNVKIEGKWKRHWNDYL